MKYDNRDYPHPVLGIGDDIDGTFICSLSVKSDPEYTVLNPVLRIQNEELEKLISNGKASMRMQVYCRGTMFRDNWKINDPLSDVFKIPTCDLSGEAEVDFFICAEDYLRNYKNPTANSVFSDTSFEIRKGYILAYGGKGKFYANKSPEKLKAVSSFMRIKCGDFDMGSFRLDYDDNKFVTVIVSKKDYELYYPLKSNRDYWNIIHASLVFPSLVEVAYFMSDEESGSSEYDNTQWYKIYGSLLSAAKGNTIIEKVQYILDFPLNRALIDLDLETDG